MNYRATYDVRSCACTQSVSKVHLCTAEDYFLDEALDSATDNTYKGVELIIGQRCSAVLVLNLHH